MNQEQANLFLRFDGYKVYYKPRSTGDSECGGGTAVIVKETVVHSRITDLDKDHDHVGIKVETVDFCFNLISLYAPSNSLKKETLIKYKNYGLQFILYEWKNS
jgi:exonuclease III